MAWSKSSSLLLLFLACLTTTHENKVSAFVPTSLQNFPLHQQQRSQQRITRDVVTTRMSLKQQKEDSDVTTTRQKRNDEVSPWNKSMDTAIRTTVFSVGLALATWTTGLPSINSNNIMNVPVANAADSTAIVKCLFQKCKVSLARCIVDPRCLANVICINTCNGKADETGCQIECGNFFENEVVGEFNKCVVTDMKCVPQKPDNGEYPVPAKELLVPKFETKFFSDKLYITAGQNPLFDIFPCQVHFFTETAPGKFYGKLNWRIEEPDGEFFNRDAIQQFVQDPENPAHLINHDNEYLHYEDDWYIVDYEYENNADGIPPFAFVYYRGSNDAWIGYGGATVYTKAAKLPEELIPRLRVAAEKVGMDWDKEFVVTDNSCPPVMSTGESVVAREKFAGKVILQSEEQVQAAATRFRGTASNSALAQKVFIENEAQQAGKAFQELSEKSIQFEQEIVGKVVEIEKGAVELEKEVVKEAVELEKEAVSKVIELEQKLVN